MQANKKEVWHVTDYCELNKCLCIYGQHKCLYKILLEMKQGTNVSFFRSVWSSKFELMKLKSQENLPASTYWEVIVAIGYGSSLTKLGFGITMVLLVLKAILSQDLESNINIH